MKFYNPTKIFFGKESIDSLNLINSDQKIVIVTSKGAVSRNFVEPIKKKFYRNKCELFLIQNTNPDVTDLNNQVIDIINLKPEIIIAVGGGSVIDSAKYFAKIIPNTDFVKLMSSQTDWQTLRSQSLPVYALPTTSGTGSEVTPFATIWDKKRKKKLSLFGDDIFPTTAILNPEFTHSLPHDQTLFTGLDALSHALESIWNINANDITIKYAQSAINLILNSLEDVLACPENAQAREEMMKASLYAGLAISNTRTALAHAISYPLTINLGVPHGLACGFTLPAILKFHLKENIEYFDKIFSQIGYKHAYEFYDALKNIYSRLEINKKIKLFLGDVNLDFVPHEVIEYDRAQNKLIPINESDIAKILNDSRK